MGTQNLLMLELCLICDMLCLNGFFKSVYPQSAEHALSPFQSVFISS